MLKLFCWYSLLVAAAGICSEAPIGSIPRLVVISNDVPIRGADGQLPPGGLASGLESAIAAQDTLWFGSSGDPDFKWRTSTRTTERGNIKFATMELPSDLQAKYFDGFSNGYLWPLFHSIVDKVEIHPGEFTACKTANKLFAEQFMDFYFEKGDIIWVHDYHLIPLGRELRDRASKTQKSDAQLTLTIGFFMHIPIPSIKVVFSPATCDLAGLSCSDMQGLFRDFAAYDLIGVHTPEDEKNLRDILGTLGMETIPRIEVHPLGIDAAGFNKMAKEHADQAARWLKTETTLNITGRSLILGFERLDYTKGIPERLRGFELMLRQHPELHEQVALLQIAPPSRENVPMYQALDIELESMMHTLHLEWGGRSQVELYNKTVSRDVIAAVSRVADVGLFTPLEDGMNLAAKEFVAAFDDQDLPPDGSSGDDKPDASTPGVLILSVEAGAAFELGTGALMVDPLDANNVSEQLHKALTMGRQERIERWRRMNAEVRQNTAASWGSRFLQSLLKAD